MAGAALPQVHDIEDSEPSPVAEVLGEIRERKLAWVELLYTDVLGGYNHVHVPADSLVPSSFTDGIPKLDGSSVPGFRRIYESDMVLKPDPRTFAEVPWGRAQGGTGRFICDILEGSTHEPYAHDPRGVARRAEAVLAEAGYDRSFWGPEVEFFIFDQVRLLPSADAVRDAWGGAGYELTSAEAPWGGPREGRASIRFKEGYHRAPPFDGLEALRSEIGNVLRENFRITLDAHHHEVATAGQCEVNIRYDELVPAGDHIQDVRFVTRNIASARGLVATFMPKPVYGDNGLGLHMNQSLWQGERNAFFDADDAYAEISQTCRYYIGGLLEHARALCAITNPTTNSYRRLVPGYEAPVFIAWSRSNRSANIRIPCYTRAHAATKRIEYRTPDSAANIYLTEAALAMAGLDGVRRQLDPGAPVDEDIFKLSPRRRKELGIRELPGSLREALDCLESDSTFLRPVMADSLLSAYAELKRDEQLQLDLRPHPYEFYRYLDL